jgi:hypothetical protein
MELEHKTKIIEEFVSDYVANSEFYDEEEMELFFSYNDLGVPLAQSHTYGLIDSFTQEGINVIEETWFYACKVLNADPLGEYDSLDDVMLYGEDDL